MKGIILFTHLLSVCEMSFFFHFFSLLNWRKNYCFVTGSSFLKVKRDSVALWRYHSCKWNAFLSGFSCECCAVCLAFQRRDCRYWTMFSVAASAILRWKADLYWTCSAIKWQMSNCMCKLIVFAVIWKLNTNKVILFSTGGFFLTSKSFNPQLRFFLQCLDVKCIRKRRVTKNFKHI